MKKLLFTLLLLAPAGLFAQAYQLNLQGTRQIGKGSTGMAQPTDATSLFTNPGSASFLEANDVTFGITGAISKGRFTDKETNKVSKTDNPVGTPFNFSAVFGNPEGKIRYGLTVYTPFGSTNRWEPGSAGRFDTKEISLLSVSFQPTLSYKINDYLGVGVGLTYTYGNVDIRRDLPIQFSDGRFADSQIKSGANGFNINAGIHFKPLDEWAFALTYRSPLKMKANGGTAHFNVPEVLEGSQFPSGGTTDIEATLPLPQIFGAGVTFTPNNRWAFNLEAYLSDWSDYDIIEIEFADQVAGDNSTELIRHYNKGYSFRFGAEYKAEQNYELRAGVIVGISPIKDRYMSPDVPDADRINPSLGASYIFSEHLRMDAALLMEFISRESHNEVTNINGTYKFDLFLPSIGLTYRF